MWIALAGASLIFARFQGDFAEVAAGQVPRMALVGELASQSARLTTIATGIIGGEAEAVITTSGLKSVTTELASSLSELLAGEEGEIVRRVTAVRERLARLVPLMESRRKQRETMIAKLEALRWLNADIQNEIDPLLSDYDFNIRAMMLNVEDERDADVRARMLQQMSVERGLRDTVLQVGIDVGTVATLLVQASVARDARQVEQLQDLGYDMLARVSERIAELPDRDEFLTIRQSVALLREYFDLSEGLIAERHATLSLENLIYSSIRSVQEALSALQSDLSALAQKEKQDVLNEIDAGVRQARWALAALGALTTGLAVAGVALVFGVMRKRIIRPLGDLMSRMVLISETSGAPLIRERGRDEIARIRNAVDDFAAAIQTRDRAISDLKQTQSDLVQAGKMAALGNLSAGISHELNQPLTALCYRLELLGRASAVGNKAEVDRQAALATGLAARMQAIIAHLKRFARQAGSKHEPVALEKIVHNAISLVHNRFVESGVQPAVSRGLVGKEVMGVEVLVEQVMVNLLTNALDAVAENKDPVIQIDAIERDGIVELTVTDNGTGLGSLDPEDAMNPFVTTKDVGRGMGLGLSISYNIAKDMGGNLRLSPRASGGVTAHFRLTSSR